MVAGRSRRLAGGPRLLNPAPTRALSFGQPIHRYQRLESTQIVARQLANEGAPEGTVVLADEQTVGRGRLGNSFFSPPGGLYISIVLRPTIPLSQAPLLGLSAGLALAESVQAMTGVAAVLKWPNDLLLNGRKLSGVLIDLAADWAILGIGVNVNVTAKAFPPELRGTATSLLQELGHQISLDELCEELLRRLEGRYGQLQAAGPAPLMDAWRAAPNVLGQTVRVSVTGEDLVGIAEDLDNDGALRLRLLSGEVRRILAGDVHLRAV